MAPKYRQIVDVGQIYDATATYDERSVRSVQARSQKGAMFGVTSRSRIDKVRTRCGQAC